MQTFDQQIRSHIPQQKDHCIATFIPLAAFPQAENRRVTCTHGRSH
jgi:hypothetical protein